MNILNEIFGLRPFKTFASIITKKKIFFCKGARLMKYKGSKVKIESRLYLNKSHYKNHFHKKGNIAIFKNGEFSIYGEKPVFIYSGCKIDIHSNAKLEIGEGTRINESTRIGTKESIKIGRNCFIGDEVSIHDFDGHKINGTEGIKSIIIEDNVWIGERATILKGVHIGSGAVIAAGAIVTKDVECNTIVAGNPAKMIKENVKWEE